MNKRIYTTMVLTKKKVFETILSPALYITMALGLICAYFVISSFIGSAVADGINYSQNSIMRLISKFIIAIAGKDLLENIFSEGPFTLALYISFLPLFLYLAISSVFKYGHEKSTGAIELITYGPVTLASYFLSSILRNMIFITGYLFTLLCIFFITSIISNLLLGPVFISSLFILIFLCMTIFAYGILCSSTMRHGFSSLTIFVAIILIFIGTKIFASMTIETYSITIWTIITTFINFLSPFFYFELGITGIQLGNILLYFLMVLSMAVLTTIILYASKTISNIRGVE